MTILRVKLEPTQDLYLNTINEASALNFSTRTDTRFVFKRRNDV